MRIIEPLHIVNRKKQLARKKKIRLLTFAGILILIILPIRIHQYKVSAPAAQNGTVQTNDNNNSSAQVAGTNDTLGNIKFFTDDDFNKLYESLAPPNTETLITPPYITGNEKADKRIRQIAESRGYLLRSVPVLPIIKTNTPGLDEDDLLQPKAYESWKLLEAAAKRDNIPLKFNSGYRSIEWQRKYFTQRINVLGLSATNIINGSADNRIISIMEVVAPPGYSRHHTGYAVDFICKDGSGRAFEFTTCFDWLKKDNYANAKKHGWIPSYPDGADNQGPEPEPWEYVWVGVEATHESR